MDDLGRIFPIIFGENHQKSTLEIHGSVDQFDSPIDLIASSPGGTDLRIGWWDSLNGPLFQGRPPNHSRSHPGPSPEVGYDWTSKNTKKKKTPETWTSMDSAGCLGTYVPGMFFSASELTPKGHIQ